MIHAMSDPADEKRRLADYYSSLTDGEIENLAENKAELTDYAIEALDVELARRRLGEVLPDHSRTVDELEFQRLITIRQFRDLPEALLAKGALESAAIECHLADDNMVRMDWFISNLIGGIKLKVKSEDSEVASAILDQPILANFGVEGIGNYQQPHCPECQSLDTTFEELNKPLAYTSAYLSLPIPLHSKLWRCQACGYEWNDKDSVELTD
jgi:hypothetical protein